MPSSRVGAEIAGVAVLGVSLLALLALASYEPADPVFALAPVANDAGVVGATLAGWLFGGLGYGSLVAVGALAWIGARLCVGWGLPPLRSRFWLGTALLLISVSSLPPLLHQLLPDRVDAGGGGSLGTFLAGIEGLLLSRIGALLVNLFLLAIGGLCITGISTGAALSTLGRIGAEVAALLAWLGRGAWRLLGAGARGVQAGLSTVAVQLRGLASSLQVWREQRARRARREAQMETPSLPEEHSAPAPSEAVELSSAVPTPRRRRGRGVEPDIVDHLAERAASPPAQETFRFEERSARGPFVLPDVSLFQRPPDGRRSYDRDSLLMNSRILEKKLQDFGVTGRVVRVHPGPVITMYEYEPASGVKVNKIVNLADDLAMALRALSIRIIAPLPGKSVVGIEVPNAERETVYLRSLLEAEGFRAKRSKLLIAMGKDIFGNPVEADLAKMPHLLVAGATGTGKSVFLNSLLCSILYRVTPDELKLLLIDPKLLELSIYEGIPHLIADVVTNPKRAAAALQGIVRKMEERYQMMSVLRVRSIDQFNERVDKLQASGETSFRLRPKPGEEEGEEVPLQKLAYIVVVIDELADLMVVAAKDVEESLQRLAQMARAAGIHLVLATQRPSVDVLTGVIKANFPARVSFQVSSRTDSRTILDQNGAENLLGQGDMLFLPPGTSQLARLHGPFVSEKEVGELAAYLCDQGRPEFDETLLRMKEESEVREERGEDVDELFDQAVAIVAETRNASISYVQRRLKIGYNRAARIVEQMEIDGMVGPQEGTRPRAVYLRASDSDE
ncbi:MAG: DNA translocase FtsK 4TM domain-containing protein [Proteobacteria bacterium]|nr:DNA translocase FtsK 4TM domain-containing protein [Pseudomonadota bacterium]